MSSGQDGKSNNLDIFISRGIDDHFRSLAEAGIDDFHASVSQCAGNNFRSSIMSIEARLRHQNADTVQGQTSLVYGYLRSRARHLKKSITARRLP